MCAGKRFVWSLFLDPFVMGTYRFQGRSVGTDATFPVCRDSSYVTPRRADATAGLASGAFFIIKTESGGLSAAEQEINDAQLAWGAAKGAAARPL